jgi:hypothetical protein
MFFLRQVVTRLLPVQTAATATSGPSGSESIYQQLQDFRSERKSDLQQLGQALASGDLNAAQQAYNSLVQLGQQGPFKDSEPFQRSDRAQDFEAIGQALKSGDLAGAQQAFAMLESTFGRHIIHGGPEPPISGGGTTPPTEPPISKPPSTVPPIVISPPTKPPVSGGGTTPPTEPPITRPLSTAPPIVVSPPVEPPVTPPSSSAGAGTSELVAISLTQTINETIVFNLFGDASSTQSQAQGSSLNVQG